MPLTAKEKEVLMHRLDVPECIIESMTDCDNPPYTEDQIETGIGSWVERLKSDNYESLSHLEKCILRDIVERSTYYASQYERNVSKPHLTRQANRIEAFVAATLGVNVSFPMR